MYQNGQEKRTYQTFPSHHKQKKLQFNHTNNTKQLQNLAENTEIVITIITDLKTCNVWMMLSYLNIKIVIRM